jgi:transcriptional regulator with XRE-family HTH domain
MICESITEYLEKTGAKESELAEKVGVSQPHLNMIKKGMRRPSPELAQKIEEITGIPFRKLLLPDTKKESAA